MFKSVSIFVSWDFGLSRDLEILYWHVRTLDCRQGQPKLWQINSMLSWFTSLAVLFRLQVCWFYPDFLFLGNPFRGWKLLSIGMSSSLLTHAALSLCLILAYIFMLIFGLLKLKTSQGLTLAPFYATEVTSSRKPLFLFY